MKNIKYLLLFREFNTIFLEWRSQISKYAITPAFKITVLLISDYNTVPVFKARDPVQSIFCEKIHGNSTTLDVRVFEEKLNFAEKLPWLMHESTNSAKISNIVKNSGSNS